jgi:hypothetical protein
MVPGPKRAEDRKAMRRWSAFAAMLILLPAVLPMPASSQALDPVFLLKIDLLRISEQLDVRYRWADTGVLPPDYILLGSPEGALFLHTSFLRPQTEFRKTYREYDPVSRNLFSFKVPGHERFVRTEERSGPYFSLSARPMDLEGMDMSVESIGDLSAALWRDGLHKVWVDDVKFALASRKSVRTGRGGLIDINIPISLPKQLEAIFGKGEETRLTVSGREKITIGGTSRWCANCPRTEGMPQQQKFPDLEMEQQLTVNLHGTIGEKINVAIDHSSMGGDAPSTNRIRLNYTGFDDEIIKLIEMGDTDLTLSGAQLISYSGQAKGLFGVKGVAQVGPLDLTVIASKEEGESSSGTFSSSGGRSNDVSISDYAYIKRQFYYLETPGEDFQSPQFGFGQFYPVIGGANSDSLEVFVTLRTDIEWSGNSRPKYYINAWTDPNNDGNLSDGEKFTQWFYLLYEGVDYDLIQDYGSDSATPRYLGIRLRQPLGAEKALAVRYRLNLGTQIVKVGDYGNFPPTPVDPPVDPDPSLTITAELICPPEEDFAPPSKPGAKYVSTWNMMFRNVYSLGLSGIEDATIDVKIRSVRTIIGTPEIDQYSNETYLRIFGLDRYLTSGAWGEDGYIDVRQGIINFYQGYIMFPSPQPFNVSDAELRAWFSEAGPPGYAISDSIRTAVDSLSAHLVRNNSIYDEILDKNSPPNYYEIVVEASSGSRVFNLGTFDILDGTEVVMVDGVKLSRGSDYDIDYIGGVVTLKGDYGNLPPDAKVTIDYQHKPMFGGGKSSLLGIGGNLYLSEDSRLNATFLYNSVGAPKYRPRLGEEPTRNMAADINGSFQFRPGWMTAMANMLPLVNTDAASSLSLAGEVAVSIPNPNTKGEAFIDDMEGIEDSDQINLVRAQWFEASPPENPDYPGTTLPSWPQGMEFYWYNPANTDQQKFLTTSKQDLNPKLDDRENSRMTSMFIKAINPGIDQWAGIMTGFAGGIDLSTSQYIEIWVNDYTVDQMDRQGTLHIDFGKIDEDFHQPDSNRFDVENLINWTIQDDVGFRGDDPNKIFNGDFSADKWDAERGIYRWINSRIGNSRADSEDLNRNSRLDSTNEYYSLELSLADTAIIDVQRDFQDVSSYWDDSEKGWINRKKSWRMYRLDLSKADIMGSLPPRLDKISHMRIWVEDIDQVEAITETARPADHMVEITGIKFVGSRWEDNFIRDLSDDEKPVPPPGLGTISEMKVNLGTINNKDNPSIYTPPYSPDVEEGIDNREQSLLYTFENFETGYSYKSMKRFFGTGIDFMQYEEIQFFIHPDNDLVGGVTDGMEFFLQIAYDSLNYYEMAIPIAAGHANKWQWINIRMSDLTNMKIDAIPGQILERQITDSADPSMKYMARLRGDPTLFRVRYLFAGVRNNTGMRIPRGTLWFDDAALGWVRKDIDHAERLSVSANFANIMSINAGYQRTGPEFRSLKQKSGGGNTSDNLSLSGKTEVNHFIPTLGFTLPVTGRYNKSVSKPKYLTQSDVEIIDDAIAESQKTTRNSYSYSVSISRRGSKNPIMKHLFDNLKAGASYSKNNLASPTALDTSWSYSWNTNYQVQFSKDRKLNIFNKVALRYWLTSFSVSAAGSKSLKNSYSYNGERFVQSPTGFSHGWSNEMAMSYDPLESIKMNFSLSEKRNMLNYREFYGVPIGRLYDYRQNFELQYQPRGYVWFISQFNPRFEYTSRYGEDLNPSLRKTGDPEDTRNVSNDRQINIVFDVDVGGYAIDFGKRIKLLGENERAAQAPGSSGASLARQKEDFQKIMEDRLKPTRGGTEPGLELEKEPGKPPADNTAQPPPAGQQAEDEKKGAYSDLMVKKPRGTIEGLGQPKTEAPKEALPDTAQKEGGDYFKLVRVALRFIGKIEPIKSSIRIDDRSSYQRLYERADWMYRLGLDRSSGAIGSSCTDEICEVEREPYRASKRITLDLRSGLDLTTNISADVRFNLSKRAEEADSRLTESQDMTWPDIAINWKGLENWGILKGLVKSSNFTINYIRKTSKSISVDRQDYALSPNWSLTWKNTLSTNLSFAYSRQTKIEKNQEVWDQTWSGNLELRYDIKGSKGIGLPIPGLSGKKIKFESNLTTVLNLGYSSTESYNLPASTVITVAPRFTYTFSRNISGSLMANYKRTAGGRYGYINHEVGLHASAEFKF